MAAIRLNPNTRQYGDFELPNKLLECLNTMRINEEHCDVILLVQDERFGAHRVVLAANSSYFQAMFSTSSSFNEAHKREIRLTNVDKNAVNKILTYFYTGRIELNRLNFEDVFVLANLWNVPFILNVCSEDFLRHELHVSNCLGIHFLASKYQTFSSDFLEFLNRFVWKKFMAVSKEQEFLSLPVERLVEIISSDVLRVKSEEVVFENVIRWVAHDRPARQQYMNPLVKEVRLGVLNPSYLTGRVLREELIQGNPDCKNCIEEIAQVVQHRNQNKSRQLRHLTHYFNKRKTDALYIFGGYVSIIGGQKNEATSVEYLDCAMADCCLEQFSSILVGFCHVALLGNCLYFIGHGSVKRFNKDFNSWEHMCLSPEDKKALDIANVGVCTYLEYIYVVGGNCNRRFHPATNLWHGIPSPVFEHYRPGLCCLGDRIYVIGGCDKCYQESVSHVERFDPTMKTWETVSPLPTPRWGLGAVTLNNAIYAVGGYDTDNLCALNTVEIYRPEDGTWVSVAGLIHPRRRFGIAVVNGTVYVAGGYNEASVECYDEQNGSWQVLASVRVNRHDCRCLALPAPECW